MEKRKPKSKLGQLVRTADRRNIFSEGNTTNWSNEFYTITEIRSNTNQFITEKFTLEMLWNFAKETRVTGDKNEKAKKKLMLSKSTVWWASS